MRNDEAIEAIITIIKNSDYKPTLILVQGAPGSGKTKFAYSLYSAEFKDSNGADPHYYWAPVEADHFFNKGTQYAFDRKFLKYAHQLSLSHAAWALFHGHCIAVANTFTRDKELDPYYELAATAGANVILVRMCTDYGNTHNIPEETVVKYKRRLENETRYTPDFVIDEPSNINEHEQRQ